SAFICTPALGHFLGRVMYETVFFPFLYAAPIVTLKDRIDASSAPGTVSTSGSSTTASGPNGGLPPTQWAFSMISRDVGVVPSTKNSRVLPGAKNPWIDTFSLTCSSPKLTMPSPSPTGPALHLFGQHGG